ncbi:MAG TPA: NAD(P)-dependent oxidoreductase [Tepidisphaeraceae bacterium]|jgi:nucleoside-diphosphate-sugar epimerase|nr:NAD(P)-dependent oxidoreductase [Tepidisphaeraceae bacterium]
MAKRRILVTGAGGNIGAYFAEYSKGRYELRLMVRETKEGEKIQAFGEVVMGDLGDLPRLKELCSGVDTVLHLAGSAGPSSEWAEVLKNNIVGCYHVFVAAKAAGCQRVIYASSIHAVSGYPADVQVKPSEAVNPGDLYGVSKCFGEALGRYMAEQEGLSVICLRIGGFQPPEVARGETGVNMLDAWVSQRDLHQLIEKSIEVEGLKFGIFNGISNNRFKRLDITSAREVLGYEPVDDTTEENPEIRPLHLKDRVASHSMKDGGQESGLRNELGNQSRDS